MMLFFHYLFTHHVYLFDRGNQCKYLLLLPLSPCILPIMSSHASILYLYTGSRISSKNQTI